MVDSSSVAFPPNCKIGRPFARGFSLLGRSSKKVAVEDAQTETDKPRRDERPTLQRRRSLLDTLADIANFELDDEIVDDSTQKHAAQSQRRRSLPNLRAQDIEKIDFRRRTALTTEISSEDDSDDDDDDAPAPTAATDSAKSLLFDNDSRFKCVDDFFTLTTDTDEGANEKVAGSPNADDIPFPSRRRRRSVIDNLQDNLAALAESTRDLAAGLDGEILPTRK